MSDDKKPCCDEMKKKNIDLLIKKIDKNLNEFDDKIGPKERDEILKKMKTGCGYTEPGPTGPTKPTGPTGPTGPIGPTGPTGPIGHGDCNNIIGYYAISFFIKTIDKIINNISNEKHKNKLYRLKNSINLFFQCYRIVTLEYYYNKNLETYLQSLLDNADNEDKEDEDKVEVNKESLKTFLNTLGTSHVTLDNLDKINIEIKTIIDKNEVDPTKVSFNDLKNFLVTILCNNTKKKEYEAIEQLQAFFNQVIGGNIFFKNLITHLKNKYYIEGFYLDKNNKYNKIFYDHYVPIQNSSKVSTFLNMCFMDSKYSDVDFLKKIGDEIKNEESVNFPEFDKMIKFIQGPEPSGAYGSRKLPKKISIKKRRSLRKRSLRKRSLRKRSLRKRSLRKRSLRKRFKHQ